MIYILIISQFFAGSYEPPRGDFRVRYYAGIGVDTISFLLVNKGDTSTSISGFTKKWPAPNWSLYEYTGSGGGDFGVGGFSRRDKHLVIQHESFSRNPIHDTIFDGYFNSDYQTITGILHYPKIPAGTITFYRDHNYFDSQMYVQDSLLRSYQIALFNNDRDALAEYNEYPLRVQFFSTKVPKWGYSKTIKTKKDFLKNFDKIFTPITRDRILNYHAPFFRHEENWSIGIGDIWMENEGWDKDSKMEIEAFNVEVSKPFKHH